MRYHLILAHLILCSSQQLVWASITSYVALGDSYPAGDGVGSSRLLPIFDLLCGRFDGAYPNVIANSSQLHIGPFDFKNMACGGATTSSVIKTQLPSVRDFDLITLQVGGNEVDFFRVINECVFQWRTFSTCEIELTRARGLIQSTNFIAAFDHMVAVATRKVGQRGQLILLGYARFFNGESRQCDGITFSKSDPTNYLTQTLRVSLNELLIMLNNVIKASAEAHGAVFLDIDPLFEGHRFCEEDAIEPQPDNEQTWFFKEAPVKKHHYTLPSFQDIFALPNPFKNFADLTRTFHPTRNGHAAIAKQVIQLARKL